MRFRDHQHIASTRRSGISGKKRFPRSRYSFVRFLLRQSFFCSFLSTLRSGTYKVPDARGTAELSVDHSACSHLSSSLCCRLVSRNDALSLRSLCSRRRPPSSTRSVNYVSASIFSCSELKDEAVESEKRKDKAWMDNDKRDSLGHYRINSASYPPWPSTSLVSARAGAEQGEGEAENNEREPTSRSTIPSL